MYLFLTLSIIARSPSTFMPHSGNLVSPNKQDTGTYVPKNLFVLRFLMSRINGRLVSPLDELRSLSENQ